MKRELLIVIGFMSLLVLSGWVEVAPIPTRRSDMACVQGEDKIYLTGGCSSDQVYETNNSVCETVSTRLDVYTPATDSWTTLAQMPRTRNRHVSAYYSGKVYVIGGRDQNDNIIQEVDVYDVQSNTWSTLPQLFTMATSDFAINVIGTKAILSGGYIQDYHDTNKTHIFNLDTATFDYNVTETTRGRGDVCGEVIGNDAFTFGGYEDTNFCSPVSTIEQFNLNKLLWSYVPTVNTGVNGGDGACFAYKGRFFAIGGEQKDSRCFSLPIASAESYDPVADSWASEPDFALPEGRFRFCGLTFNGQPYVFGGQGPLEIKGGEDSHPILAYVLTYQDPSSTASFISSSSFFVFSVLLGISLAFASGVSF